MHVCDLQANNDILAFLSGMPVTRNTKYLDLKNAVSHQLVISPVLSAAFKSTASPPYFFTQPCSLFSISANFYSFLPLFGVITKKN